ncbi:hypothetical protein K470DRAFT_254396 [Piedraia hortae CBS 480.64]|uniref:Uncharacterized protein n=1 Tax=Piedraia hortae CBS 480.64 TaxID=1314780 RepID=A0A6A7C921_9PEZI|nr:hypothetical protein K470DRAFT_254396 [Piedraia hortae CBS 480.64]
MRIPSVPSQTKWDITKPHLDHVAANTTQVARLLARSLLARDDSGSSSDKCKDNENSPLCQKPTDSSNATTLAIVLGAAIPIISALVVLFFLHRRSVRKQALEDANDPHKSLDFGLDIVPSGGKRGIPEMTVTDMGSTSGRKGRGQSMDMGSPYVMPGELKSSKDSLHSMSLAMPGENDPYRPVAMMRTSSDSRRPMQDNMSTHSVSTMHSSQELLGNAQTPSRAEPRRGEPDSPLNEKNGQRQLHSRSRSRSRPGSRKASLGSLETPLANIDELGPSPPLQHPAVQAARAQKAAVPVPRIVQEPMENSMPAGPRHIGRFSIDTPNPSEMYPAAEPEPVAVMGLRPLPPDMPDDNPEMRANRIRSFYKEYFEDGRPNPAQAQYPNVDPSMAIKPFAEGPGRRAMTPPPAGERDLASAHGRHYSTQTARPRGRTGPSPQVPQKPREPPKALNVLPTPGLLKSYDSVIDAPMDFAPPTSMRQLQNGGRPDSPFGGARPYSPAVKAFNPLASSFDDLHAMPSPYMLRKSGQFTSIDFAPPARLRDADNGSDVGSIRSARSGISAVQLDAVRAGAYRVSRIPKEVVTTRDDIATQLRPKMNLINPA